MTPARLRSCIRRYGRFGVLLAGAYLGGRHLWARRNLLLLSALLCIGFGLIHPRSHMTRSRPLPENEARASAPAISVSDDMPDQDKLVAAINIMETGHHWRVEVWWPKEGLEVGDYALFYCNGRLIRKLFATEVGGRGFEIYRPDFATADPLVVLLAQPPCGHDVSKNLFSLRRGRLIGLGRVGGEYGGPEFRDVDGDGRPEWVFDDYCWYEYYSAGPKHYLIYKQTSEGKLKLWKRVLNRSRKRLPNLLTATEWN